MAANNEASMRTQHYEHRYTPPPTLRALSASSIWHTNSKDLPLLMPGKGSLDMARP
jgi:hypothetical protein